MKGAIPVVLEHTGFIAEGAAAAVFALCMREASSWRGQSVAALFSGGNLGMDGVREMVQNLDNR